MKGNCRDNMRIVRNQVGTCQISQTLLVGFLKGMELANYQCFGDVYHLLQD